MSMEKIYPKPKESFGTLLIQRKISEKADWNAANRQRTVTHIGYELESSVQEGAITVFIPAKEVMPDEKEFYDKEVTLVNPVLELSPADIREGKAVYEIYASRIQFGGNK